MVEVKYEVLEVLDSGRGALKNVRSKYDKSPDTLQDALDELGAEGWRLTTNIYGPARAGRQGNHHCEGLFFYPHCSWRRAGSRTWRTVVAPQLNAIIVRRTKSNEMQRRQI